MKRICLALILICLAASAGQARQLIWKTEKELVSRQELPGCDTEKDADCPDSVSYVNRSQYGMQIFETYHEAVRVTYSFNRSESDGFTVSTDQIHPGSYDWGGVVEKGKFKPLYMIKRFYSYDATGSVNKAQTELTVLRLLANGKTCGVYTGKITVTDNVVARRFAEKNFAHPACSQ